MTLIRAGTMLGRSINKLNKNELIKEVKKLQLEISSIEDDYIKEINKLQDEKKKLYDKIMDIDNDLIKFF